MYATSLNNLGMLYHAMGNYAKVESLHRQALEIRKCTLGESHPDYAASLNNLADLYRDTAEFAKAELLYRNALEITKRCGREPPRVCQYAEKPRAAVSGHGGLCEGEPLHPRALEIRRRAFGNSHPDYASGLQNLASLYLEMADYAKAEPLYRQALEIRKRAEGENHPDYAISLNNLATMYSHMGDYAKAESLIGKPWRSARRRWATTTATMPIA